MIKPWNRTKTLMLIIVILSLIGIYVISSLYIINPLKIEKDNVLSEVSVYQAQIEKINNHENDIDADANLEEVTLSIPSSKSPDDVLFTVEKLSKESEVTVEEVRSANLNQPNENEEEELGVTTRETYFLNITASKLNNINVFLDQLLLADRLLVIDSLDINQSNSEISAEITFSAYHTNP